MNKSWPILLLVITVLGIAAGTIAWKAKSDSDQNRRSEQVSRDMETLQGRWVVTVIDDGSRGAYHDWLVKNAIGQLIEVDGKGVILESPESDPSTIMLNPAQPFNGIDLQMWDIVYHGIYELSNGTWKVCFPNKSEMGRPKSMAVSPDKLSVYIELRKQPVGER